MNEMTRQELDDRLLDYLYDELDPGSRSAFERALSGHPDIAKEVEAHRATRKAYQALPREVAPAGLLAGVLALADSEAARRAQPATSTGAAAQAAGQPAAGFWEKLRRIVFQPTFAMAMVVLVVAGVSLVGTRKGELPGMKASADAQHIPPVAVNEAPERTAGARGASTATLEQQNEESGARERGLLAGDEGERPTPEPENKPVDSSLRDAELRGPAAALAKAAAEPLPDPAPLKALTSPGSKREGVVADAKKPIGGARGGTELELDRNAAGDFTSTDGRLDGVSPKEDRADNGLEDKLEVEEVGEDAAARGEVWDKRRESNFVDPTPRAPPEPRPAAKNDVPAGPTPGAEKKKGEGEVPPTELARTPAEAPTAPPPVATPDKTPARSPDAPKLATKDGASEPPSVDDALVRKESPEPVRTTERVQTAGEQGRAAPSDEADGDRRDKRPATLTPPAKSAEQLWSTYQQQAAAGAYVDAQRSIEALAKVEGESSRVKLARAELKKRIEATTDTGGANKLPPDPPAQRPK